MAGAAWEEDFSPGTKVLASFRQDKGYQYRGEQGAWR
jgi:hypothetical protein